MKMLYDDRMPCRYTEDKDLSDRLHGTICRYAGQPVMVHFYDTKQLKINDPHTGGNVQLIRADDPLFDIASPEVGYFTYQDKVVYAVRTVKKQYRQGLCSSNMFYQTIDGAKYPQASNFLMTKDMISSLRGEYPTMSQALASIGKKGERAISLDVAIRREESGVILVFWRTKNIGWILPNQSKVSLKEDSFSWIAERFLSKINMEYNH